MAAVPTAGRRQGSVFSIAIRAGDERRPRDAHHPEREQRAISAQQHPTHQAPCLAPICSAPDGPLAPRCRAGSRAGSALAEAHVLERRQLVDGRGDELAPATQRPGAIPREHVA